MKHEVTIPNNYTLCIKNDCPKAATCLRHVAVGMMSSEIQRWSIVSQGTGLLDRHQAAPLRTAIQHYGRAGDHQP